MNTKHKNCGILVTGINKDIDRILLRDEFSRFGNITKLYLEPNGKFARLLYPNYETCLQTYNYLKKNTYNWTLYYLEDKLQFSSLEKEIINDLNSDPRFQTKPVEDNPRSKMYYSPSFEDAQLNTDYCNIHGDPLSVFESTRTGDIFINLNDLKRTGFLIFRRDIFNHVRIHPDEVTHELEIFLLSEASKYILQNRAVAIDEERLYRTIENVKRRLLGDAVEDDRSQFQNKHDVGHQSVFRSQLEYKNHEAKNSYEFRNSYEPRNQSEYRNTPEYRKQIDSRSRSDYRNQQEHRNQPDNRPHYGNFKNQFQDDRNQRFDSRSDGSNRGRSHSRGRKQENQNSDVAASLFTDMKESVHQISRPPKHFPINFSANNKFVPSSVKQEKSRAKASASNDQDKELVQNTSTNGIGKQKQLSSSSSTSSERTNPNYENVEKTYFEIGKEYEVIVCYHEPEKENICWVHEKQSVDQLQQMMLDICELEPSLEPLSTSNKGQLVLGLYDEVWWRARVIQHNSNSNMLYFLDYGNKSKADAIKPLPDRFKKFPSYAVRLVVNRVKLTLEDGQEFTIKVNRKYDDDTYLVDAIEGSSLPKEQESNLETTNPPSAQIGEEKASRIDLAVPESVVPVLEDKPAKIVEKRKVVEEIQTKVVEEVRTKVVEKAYFNVPKSLTAAKHGDIAIIVDFRDGRFYLKTKDCFDKGKELNAYIKELDKSKLAINVVKEGQLVLCSKEGANNLFRATVVEKQDSLVAKVSYIDYPGTDSLSVKSLRNVDEYLSKQPALILTTSELPYLKKLSRSGENYIAEMMQQKEKLTVEISKDQMDFRQGNGELLSKTLLGLEKPIKEIEPLFKPSTSAVIHEEKKVAAPTTKIETNEKVFYDDMPFVRLDKGVHQFVCYSVKSPSDLTLVLQRDDILEHTALLVSFQTNDKNIYKPELCEVCLVYSDEDESWYRAVVYNIEKDDYVVYAVDFGAEMAVTSDKLRILPKCLKDIPIVGIGCELADVPDTPEMAERIKEFIEEGGNLEAKVLKFVDETQKYIIEIPGLKEKLAG